MLKAWLIAGLLFAALPSLAAEEGFSELSVDQVDTLIQSKSADVFDNNSQDDWKAGHVPTAKWVKFNDVKEGDLPKDKARQLVFYCHDTH
jgi:hypothetical protein